MEKEYLFYLYISWKKEKVVVISHNNKMSKDFKKKNQNGECPPVNLPVNLVWGSRAGRQAGQTEPEIDSLWTMWVKDI